MTKTFWATVVVGAVVVGGLAWRHYPTPTPEAPTVKFGQAVVVPPACSKHTSGNVWCFNSQRVVGGWISLAVRTTNVSAVWQNNKKLVPITDYAVNVRNGQVMVDIKVPRTSTNPEMFRVVMQ